MNYIRNAISNTRLQYRISKAINDAILDPRGDGVMAECHELADSFPELLLQSLATGFLSPSQPEKAFKALELLEQLVQNGSRVFHLALSRSHAVQQKLLSIAMRRVDGTHPFQQRAQRLARLTLLEYSRIFMEDPDLQHLSTLAALFESRTKRNLLRALNVQNRHIAFTEPRASDVVLISPRKGLAPKGPVAFLSNGGVSGADHHNSNSNSNSSSSSSSSAGGMPYATLQEFFAARMDKMEPLGTAAPRKPLPKSMTCPKRWVCPACQQNNSPMALLCAACETSRYVDEDDRAQDDEEEEGEKLASFTLSAAAAPRLSAATETVLIEVDGGSSSSGLSGMNAGEAEEESGNSAPNGGGETTGGGGPTPRGVEVEVEEKRPEKDSFPCTTRLREVEVEEEKEKEKEKEKEAPTRPQEGRQEDDSDVAVSAMVRCSSLEEMLSLGIP